MDESTKTKSIPVLGTQGECIGLFEILTEYMEALDVMRYCLEFAYDMKTREIVHVSIRYLQPIERKWRIDQERRLRGEINDQEI